MTAAELAAGLTHPIVRAPIVVTRHFAKPRGSSAPSRLLGRAIARTVTAQISISAFVAARIDGPSTVIHLGTAIPATVVPPADRELSVLVAQRFEAEKRTDLAIQVWAASGMAEKGWKLRLAGDGALRRNLEILAADLGVSESCDFLGYQQDLASLLGRSAVFLAPGPNEGFGLSVVEAMANATPVVAAAEGGHAETVGASPEGMLYPALDVEKGGRVLAELCSDFDRRARYGAQLQDLQQRDFSISGMVGATVAFYRSVLA